jgi:hypothetical protein
MALKTRDRAGDDQPLDLRGALEDRVNLRVASHPLNWVVAGEAVYAEDCSVTLTAVSLVNSFDIEPSAASKGWPLAAIQDALYRRGVRHPTVRTSAG